MGYSYKHVAELQGLAQVEKSVIFQRAFWYSFRHNRSFRRKYCIFVALVFFVGLPLMGFNLRLPIAVLIPAYLVIVLGLSLWMQAMATEICRPYLCRAGRLLGRKRQSQAA